MDINTLMARSKIESEENWRELVDKIPVLNFKQEWDVKIIPPFSGAIARFMIIKNDKLVASVYLDWYAQLGCMDSPYYELYSYENDVKRYLLDETEQLLKDIETLWSEQ